MLYTEIFITFNNYVCSSLVPKEVQEELEEIIDEFVGNEADIVKNGSLTAFQMSSASHIEGCTGAFNMAISYEIQKRSHGVTKDMKVENVKKNLRWMELRSRLVQVRDSLLFEF